MSTTSRTEAGAPPESEPVVASALGSELKAALGAAQPEDDLDEIKADVKQLVKALHSLAPQLQSEPVKPNVSESHIGTRARFGKFRSLTPIRRSANLFLIAAPG
jgi:hypothetical protein